MPIRIAGWKSARVLKGFIESISVGEPKGSGLSFESLFPTGASTPGTVVNAPYPGIKQTTGHFFSEQHSGVFLHIFSDEPREYLLKPPVSQWLAQPIMNFIPEA
jgi:hypothetical protein